MLYNDLISYNQPGINFIGDIKIIVPGVSSPILIGGVKVFFASEIDYSNSTTLGVVTVVYSSSGSISLGTGQQSSTALVSYVVSETDSTAQISIETDLDTATAISNASQININSYSEISIDY